MRTPPFLPLPALAIAALALAADASRADAIPAFARRYSLSCAACHSAVPRLNAAGERFALNGFRFAPREPMIDTIATGDATLALPRGVPLALRFDAFAAVYPKTAAGEAAVDLQAPWVLKLLSGGPITSQVSYYLYFLASERGEVGGLEDAYLQFSDVLGSGVSVIAGQFQVSDPLFKRELRLEYEDYQAYRLRVGEATANLAYDRGVMFSASPWSGGDVVLSVVAGRGLAAAGATRRYDTDKYVNPSLRVAQTFGRVRVGAFGYLGNERAFGATNQTLVYGPDVAVDLGERGSFGAQFLRRTDGDPFFGTCTPLTPCPTGATAPFSTTVDAAFAELVLSPRGSAGNLFFTAIANWVDGSRGVVSVDGAGYDVTDEYVRRHLSAAAGVHWLLARNIRLMGEAGWDFEHERSRIIAGVVTAF